MTLVCLATVHAHFRPSVEMVQRPCDRGTAVPGGSANASPEVQPHRRGPRQILQPSPYSAPIRGSQVLQTWIANRERLI